MNTQLKRWRTIHSRQILVNPYFNIFEDLVLLPSGKKYRYYYVNPKDRVALILPVDARGRILVAKEYRHPIGRVVYGSIGGGVEKGEQPQVAAARELREEAGYRAKRYVLLGKIFSNPARSGATFYLYAAFGLRQVGKEPEAAEFLEHEFFSRQKLNRLITTGQLKEPYLMAAYLLYSLKLKK